MRLTMTTDTLMKGKGAGSWAFSPLTGDRVRCGYLSFPLETGPLILNFGLLVCTRPSVFEDEDLIFV